MSTRLKAIYASVTERDRDRLLSLAGDGTVSDLVRAAINDYLESVEVQPLEAVRIPGRPASHGALR